MCAKRLYRRTWIERSGSIKVVKYSRKKGKNFMYKSTIENNTVC